MLRTLTMAVHGIKVFYKLIYIELCPVAACHKCILLELGQPDIVYEQLFQKMSGKIFCKLGPKYILKGNLSLF